MRARVAFALLLVAAVPGCASPPLAKSVEVRPGKPEGRVYHLVPSPDSRLVAVVFEKEDRTCIFSLEDGHQLAGIPCAVWGGIPPLFSPDARTVALMTTHGFAIHEVSGGKLVWESPDKGPAIGPGRPVFADGGRVVEADWNTEPNKPSPRVVVRYDAATGKEVERRPLPDAFTELSPGGRFAVLRPRESAVTKLEAFDRAAGKTVATADLPAATTSDDQWRLHFADDDSAVFAFRELPASKGARPWQVRALDLPQLHERFQLEGQELGTEFFVAPGGRHLVICGVDSATTYDAHTGQKVASWSYGLLHHGGQLRFTPDGARAIGTCSNGETGEFHLWDVATGKKLETFPREFDGAVLHVFRDGRRVLVRAPNDTLDTELARFRIEAAYHLFDMETGGELARFEGRRCGRAVVSPDERQLVWTTGTEIQRAEIPGVAGK